MEHERRTARAERGVRGDRGDARGYEPPRYEVIALDCEITAYAPDDDTPLF